MFRLPPGTPCFLEEGSSLGDAMEISCAAHALEIPCAAHATGSVWAAECRP